MKVILLSDIHFEIYKYDPLLMQELNNIIKFKNEQKCPLFLCGDILKHFLLNQVFEEFYKNDISGHKTFYIMGNHEHYGKELEKNIRKFDEYFKEMNQKYGEKVIFLNDDIYHLNDDISIIGSTLWTNMNNQNPDVMNSAETWMNDYSSIKFFNKITSSYPSRLRATDTIKINETSFEYIKQQIELNDKKFIIMTHHAPSEKSVHERFYGNKEGELINHCYYSNYDDFITKNTNKIIAWFHGHTHEPFEYNIAKTKIFCRPVGYIQQRQKHEELDLTKHLINI